MNLTDCQYRFKMIMIGYNNVGKSCMLRRYTEGLYPERINCTIGVDFCSHILEVEPEVRVNLQIFDTAGHKLFWPAICRFIPQSVGCLLVFDLGDRESFDYIKHRHKVVCNIAQPYTVLFMLVGHKCDIKEQEVNQYEVEEFASELGAPYIEASAITGHNVAEAFELLTRRIYQGYLSGEVRLHESWGKIHKNKAAENNK
ncbi:ras-related protein Rab-39B [Rhinichthys klamathensis goyatoka]|uniref:ras-related protein Rab-39B n=1 Tax=Rhinichthys klamathensis goyatoka TaxID=3034132 RepID=UPI0024B61F73|nr:ras-related protein Rab-39B [Rhinichthys klamathensis goyatoka]